MQQALNQETTKKKWQTIGFIILLASLVTLLFFTEPASANTIEEKINAGSKMLLSIARGIFGSIMVVMFCWAGYSLLFSKTAEGLADLKGRIGVFLLCGALVLFAEPIYNTFQSLFS